MIKQIFAVIAGLAIAVPASATSWAYVNRLESLVANTGTDVSAIDCGDRKAYGYYHFNKAQDIDQLVVCYNTPDMSDPDEVWEVLAHEATHTMQACAGGPVIPDKYVPRVLRELQEVAPHYYRLLNEYNGHHKRIELEAFWMELRTPDTVFKFFESACYSNDWTMARSCSGEHFESRNNKKSRQGNGKNSKPKGDRKLSRGQGK